MEKKTLVSILAMASVSMGAYADANVDQIKDGAVTDWSGASDLKFENDIFVSPNGTAISQNIGKLVAGTYKLTATTNNAKLLVNGKALDANNQFVLTAETEVTITVSAVTAGQEFQVSGFNLDLVYNFTNARNTLTVELAKALAKIDETDEVAASLKEEGSQLSAKIATLKDEGADENTAYAAYVSMELYKGVAESKIMAEIKAFDTKVTNAADNAAPYLAAKAIGDAKNAEYKAVLATIDQIAETEGLRAYVKSVTTAASNAANDRIQQFLKQAEDAYKTGTAASVCTEENNKKFIADADKLITAFAADIQLAQDDHAAYLELRPKIKTLKDTYNEALKNVIAAFTVAGTDYPDVYAGLRNTASVELTNNGLNVILDAEKKNGTAENHRGAAANKDANLTALTEAETQIAAISKKYTDRAVSLKEAWDNAQTILNGLQTRLDGVAAMDGVKEGYQADIDKIQAAIDAFEGTITKDNEANTIDSKDYTGTQTTINKSIDDLITKSVGSVADYNAYVAVKENIATLQKKLDDNKKVVNALQSEDKLYSANGKYAGLEAGYQKDINGYTDGITAALKNKTALQWKTNNQSKLDGTSTKLDAYKTNAENTLANYETVTAALANYDKAISDLEKKVGADRGVWVYVNGEATADTYGSKIDGFRTSYNTVLKAKTDALAASNADHVTKMAAAVTATNGVTIVADANALVASFDADKAQYEEDVVASVIATLLAQAETNINTAQTGLDALVLTRDELGLSLEEITAEKSKIQGKLTEQKNDLETAKGQPDDADKMAVLSTINTALDAIKVEVNTLSNKIAGVKASVKANKDQKDVADKQAYEIDVYLNGGTLNNTAVKSVIALNEDANRSIEFGNLVSGLQTKLNTLNADMLASTNKETMVADWKDKTVEGQTVKGYATRLSDLLAEVNEARTKAVASTDNWKAYQEVVAYYGAGNNNLNIQGNINQAKADVPTVTDGTSETYYLNQVAGYQTQFNKLVAAVFESYDKKRTSVKDKDAQKASLLALNNNIKAVKGLAEANEKKYQEQLTTKKTGYNAIVTLWQEVYYEISTGDQSTQVDVYLNQLAELQTQYLALKTNMDSYYANGQSDAKHADVTSALSSIFAEITDIQKTQEEGYNEAIAADNKVRYDAFVAAVEDVREQYTEALNIIGQFSQLQNPGFVAEVGPAVTDANTEINGILTRLRTLESETAVEYTDTEAGQLFDEFETNKQSANDLQQEIIAALDKMDDRVNTLAVSYFTTQYNTYNGKLQTAIAELESYSFTTATVNAAFADVRKIIRDAKIDLDAQTYLAIKIDGHLQKFATVDQLLAVGKETAAKAEGKAEISRVQKEIENQLADLNKFVYTNDADNSIKNGYINEYNNIVKNQFDAPVATYNSAVASGQAIYGNVIVSLKNALATFETTADAIYNEAKSKSDHQKLNQSAYDEVMKKVSELQISLAASKDFVSKYIVLYDFSDIENSIANLTSDFNIWLEKGSCATNKNYGFTVCGNIASNIATVYTSVNITEETRLKTEIQNLYGDQNLAADAVEGTDKVAEVEAYRAEIDALQTEFDKKIIDPTFIALDAKGRQTVYLSYEATIAKMRAELATYYSTENVYGNLVTEIGTVKEAWEETNTLLSGTHANVQAQFNADLAAENTAIVELEAELDRYNAAGQVIFAQAKIKEQVKILIAALDVLSQDIKDAQIPYTINENVYQKLSAEIDGLSDKLTALQDKVAKFEFELVGIYSYYVKRIEEGISEAQEILDADYKKWSLTESDVVYNKATIESRLTACDKATTYNELYKRITDTETEGKESLTKLVNAVSDMIDQLNNSQSQWFCTESTERELIAERDAIKKLSIGTGINNDQDVSINAYNINAYNGVVYYDVNGNKLVDTNGDPIYSKPVSYLDEAPAIEVRINELKAQVAALKQKTEENRFKLGDMDRDGSVVVDDYMAVLDIVKNYTEEEKEALSELKFMTADANQDGSINIGDLTAITNTILGVNYSRMQYIKARTAETVDGAIALGLENQEGVQRIAVRLSNAAAYTSYQMDVKLPAGVSVMSASLGMGAADHEIYTNTLADGTYRVVVTSMQNNKFADGDDALIYLEVSGKAAAQVTVTEAMAADATGKVYNVRGIGGGETTGIDGVTADQSMKAKIYSVGGQLMDKVTRGINIIRNADGTTKKVLKK